MSPPVLTDQGADVVIQLPRGRGDGEANIRNGGSGTASGSSSVDADVVWATFPAVFLRDNCASAVHPKTRQRTVLVWELPPDLSIVTATWGHRQLPDGGIAAAGTGAPQEASMVLEVEWSDGATSTFDHQWLCDHQLYQEEDAGDTFTRAAALEMQPWRVADLPDGAGALPEVDFAAVMADDAELLRLLDAICTVGVARVTSMPDGDPEAGAMLANRIGHGQPTVYGDHFDVVVKENTHAAAYTSDALPLHTDLPYYTQPPGVQLLHSVTAVPPTNGGRSLLADGLAVAHELRQRNPSAYAALSTLPVCYQDVSPSELTTSLEVQSGWDLRAERPVIVECRLGGRRAALPTEINFANGVRASHPNLGVDDTRRLYAGLRAFGEVLHEPTFLLETTLKSGQAIIFNNRRILHGRTPIVTSAPRWLRGRYIELDLVRSRRRILQQDQGRA